MPIVDDRGRVFGRFNAVDAFVVALVLVMMPVAYAAFVLFRAPQAKLTGVEPKQIAQGPNLRVRIAGTNLRPFMRVSFDTVQGRTFLIGSTNSAEVDLPNLDPGTYDVVLYDAAQELDRLPKAFTMLPRIPAPTVTVSVVGSFIGLTEKQTEALKAGAKLGDSTHVTGTVVATGPRRAAEVQLRTGDSAMAVPLKGQYALPAALEIECFLENAPDSALRCLVQGPMLPAFVGPESVVTFAFQTAAINFQVNEVHPPGPPTTLRVKLQAGPNVPVKLRVGETDSTMPEYAGAWAARVESVNGGEVVLRLPVQKLANGWKYRSQFVKLGAGFRFETPSAVLNGTVLDLAPIDGGSQ